MKLAVVVQRYGADINGGAELHARYIAERLAKHAQVEVVTTCARDYVSWRNELDPGTESINGVPVRRFPVTRERHPLEFGRRSRRVFDEPHSLADELSWLESEGPASPALVDYLARSAAAFDYILLFSYRYYHAWHGARRAAGQGDARADGRARRGDRSVDVRTGLPGRARRSCTTRTRSAR